MEGYPTGHIYHPNVSVCFPSQTDSQEVTSAASYACRWPFCLSVLLKSALDQSYLTGKVPFSFCLSGSSEIEICCSWVPCKHWGESVLALLEEDSASVGFTTVETIFSYLEGECVNKLKIPDQQPQHLGPFDSMCLESRWRSSKSW